MNTNKHGQLIAFASLKKDPSELAIRSKVEERNSKIWFADNVSVNPNESFWTIFFLSGNVFEVSGYSKEDIEKKSIKSINHLILDKDQSLVNEKIRESLAASRPWEIEYRILNQSNEVRWVFERGRAVYDEVGAIKFFEGFLLDITERKSKELVLLEERNNYKDLLNTQPSGVYRLVFRKREKLDSEGFTKQNHNSNFEILNKRMLELIGFDKDSIEIDPFEIAKLVHPEDQDSFLQKNYESVNLISPFFWEGRMRTFTSPAYKWVQFRSTPTIHENGDIVYTGILTDISERKAREERENHFKNLLKYIIENMDSTVAMLDQENRFLYASQKYLKDFGIEGMNIIGVNTYEVFPNLPENIRIAHKLALQGVASKSEKDEIILPDQIVYNKWSCIPWFESSGEVGGYIVYIEDITPRVKLENKLKQQQKKLQEAQRIAKIGNWELDLQTNELFWSDEVYSLLGLERSKSGPVYDDFLRALHPDDRSKVDQAFRDAITYRKPYEIVHRLLLESGEIRAVQEKSEIYYDDDNTPLKAIGTVQDITETVATEEALKKTNQFLNNLFTYANAPIIIWDSDFKITKFNKAFEKYTGRGEEEVLGKHIELLFPPDAVESSMELIKQTSYGERWETVEIPIQHISGDIFTFIWNSAPIINFEENETVGTIAQGQDITERKRAVEEIKSLNQNLEQIVQERTERLNESLEILNNTSSRVPGMIFQLKRSNDGMLTFPFVSPGIKDLWGLQPEEVANDASIILDKIHPSDIEGVINTMNESLHNPKPLSYEYRIFGDNEDIKWLFTNALTYVDEDNNVLWYGHTYDITNRKRSEEEIIHAKEEAELANQAKSKFLSRMSHELRTPLNSILGFAQLMELGELSEGHKKSLDYIISSGKHLLHLINEVLDITAIESGKYRLSLESVEVNSLVKEIINLIKPASDKKGVSITVSSKCPAGLYAFVDRLRLKQVLMNLLDNSIKYNVENGRVFVTCGIDPGDPEKLFIMIEDTGKGIAEQDLEVLYDPFQRLGAERSSIEGSGLGLTIVKHLVDAMHGSIHVTSEIGLGTVFTVVFPLTLTKPESKEDHENFERRDIDSGENLDQWKVLYVEDNLPNIDLVKEIIDYKFPSIKLITSKLGIPTVRLAIKHKPKLILLDLDLPDIYGVEILQKLKSNHLTKSIPVIIVSADASPEKSEQMLVYGAADFLVKPLELKSFVEKMNTYLTIQPSI